MMVRLTTRTARRASGVLATLLVCVWLLSYSPPEPSNPIASAAGYSRGSPHALLTEERGPLGTSVSVVVLVTDSSPDNDMLGAVLDAAMDTVQSHLTSCILWNQAPTTDEIPPGLEPELVVLSNKQPILEALIGQQAQLLKRPSFSDSLVVRIKFVLLPDEVGVAEAWNFGALLARHEHLVFLRRWEHASVFKSMELADGEGDIVVWAPHDQYYCNEASIAIRRKAFFNANMFDSRASVAQCYDRDFLFRARAAHGSRIITRVDRRPAVAPDSSTLMKWRLEEEVARKNSAKLALWSPSMDAIMPFSCKRAGGRQTNSAHRLLPIEHSTMLCIRREDTNQGGEPVVEAPPEEQPSDALPTTPFPSSKPSEPSTTNMSGLSLDDRIQFLRSSGSRLPSEAIARYTDMSLLTKHLDYLRPTPGNLFFVLHAENGLGNRIRALASGLAIAQASGRRLRLVWLPNEHLNVRFDELFELSDEFDVVSEFQKEEAEDPSLFVSYDYMKPGMAYKFIDTSLPRHIYVRSAFVLNSTVPENEWHRVAKRLTPIPEVRALMDPFLARVKFSTGMHIRMETDMTADVDKLDRNAYSPKALFALIVNREQCHVQHFVIAMHELFAENPAAQVFIAADRSTTYDYIMSRFPNNTFALRQTCSTRDAECVRYALAHLLLLSQCERLYGSVYSSFTEVAFALSPKGLPYTSACNVTAAESIIARAEPEIVRVALSLQRAWQNCTIGQFNVIASFFISGGESSNGDVGIRQREYEEVIQRNIQHPDTLKIHLLCDDEAAAARARRIFYDDCHKLVLTVMEGDHTYGRMIEYAATKIPHAQSVMIMNTDIIIGEGFGAYSNAKHSPDVVYALSRWERFSGPTEKGFCGTDMCPNYKPVKGGFLSHDAFLFINPLPDELIAKANFTTHWGGAENVFVHYLKNIAKKEVKNPCYLLKIYHNHCSNERLWKENLGTPNSTVSDAWRHVNDRLDHKLCDGRWHCDDGYVTTGPTNLL